MNRDRQSGAGRRAPCPRAEKERSARSADAPGPFSWVACRAVAPHHVRVAIRCPRCGLEYDVALFQFGRTIDCTCGTRVGCDAGLPHTAPTGERRFLVDGMLMGLARWLRLLGYDAVCEPTLSDAAMVRRCYEEGRALLTRGRKLEAAWRVPELCVVRADKPLAQLEEVVSHYDLRVGELLFTRCSRCNVRLQQLAPGQKAPELPRGAPPREPATWCPACGRFYWEGSHVERMRRSLQQRLGRTTET